MSRETFPLTIPSPWKGKNAWEWFLVLETAAVAIAFVYHSVISEWALWQRVAGIAGAVVFAASSWLQARAILRPTLRKDARIEIDPPGLLIKGANLFEEPIRIELSRIRLVTFDSSSDKQNRFPVTQPLGSTPKELDQNSYLYRKAKPGVLPADPAHHLAEMPNMAIMLNPPIQLRGRKDVRTFLTKPQYFVNQSIHVVTVSVADPEAALSSFSELGLVRAPTGHDVAALELSPEEKRQLKRLERIQWVGLAVWMILFFGVPMAYIAATS